MKVLTQANDKDVMLITSRSMLQPAPTHEALKPSHRKIHTPASLHSVLDQVRERGLCTIHMVINR